MAVTAEILCVFQHIRTEAVVQSQSPGAGWGPLRAAAARERLLRHHRVTVVRVRLRAVRSEPRFSCTHTLCSTTDWSPQIHQLYHTHTHTHTHNTHTHTQRETHTHIQREKETHRERERERERHTHRERETQTHTHTHTHTEMMSFICHIHNYTEYNEE